MLNVAHMKQVAMPIRDIIARMRHKGCGGRAARAELLRPVRTMSIPIELSSEVPIEFSSLR
jgi:hypothetical protein